ncbi:MAG: hypothetical protein U1F65_07540 [Verrucomicrobiota bacterium]
MTGLIVLKASGRCGIGVSKISDEEGLMAKEPINLRKCIIEFTGRRIPRNTAEGLQNLGSNLLRLIWEDSGDKIEVWKENKEFCYWYTATSPILEITGKTSFENIGKILGDFDCPDYNTEKFSATLAKNSHDATKEHQSKNLVDPPEKDCELVKPTQKKTGFPRRLLFTAVIFLIAVVIGFHLSENTERANKKGRNSVVISNGPDIVCQSNVSNFLSQTNSSSVSLIAFVDKPVSSITNDAFVALQSFLAAKTFTNHDDGHELFEIIHSIKRNNEIVFEQVLGSSSEGRKLIVSQSIHVDIPMFVSAKVKRTYTTNGAVRIDFQTEDKAKTFPFTAVIKMEASDIGTNVTENSGSEDIFGISFQTRAQSDDFMALLLAARAELKPMAQAIHPQTTKPLPTAQLHQPNSWASDSAFKDVTGNLWAGTKLYWKRDKKFFEVVVGAPSWGKIQVAFPDGALASEGTALTLVFDRSYIKENFVTK